MFYSIIIPVLNSVSTIEKSILSVIDNGFNASFEILVFDGGSTDGTLQVLEKYKKYLKHFESKIDFGPQHAVNKGLKLAKGEVIIFLCADDYLDHGVLNKIRDQFLLRKSDVISCGITIFEEDGEVVRKYIKKENLEFNLPNILQTPLTHGRFIKREIYEVLGGFPTKFSLCNDLYFLIKIILNLQIKHDVLAINAYNYLSHRGSATMGGDKYNLLRTYEDNYKIALEVLNDYSLKNYYKYRLLNLMFKSLVKIIICKIFSRDNSYKFISINKFLFISIFLSPIFFIEYLIFKLTFFIKR